MEAVVINDQPSTNIPGNEEGPLVAVTFQKNPHRVQKYLEAEPKALGLTQITLGVVHISMTLGTLSMTWSSHIEKLPNIILLVVGSLFVIIAGSVAVAAQNLQLPTLKACLGMQVVACVFSVITILETSGLFGRILGINIIQNPCWESMYNDTESQGLCLNVASGIQHYVAEQLLISVAVFAIGAALAAYSCKVINCCTPIASMPVITINAPPAQQ